MKRAIVLLVPMAAFFLQLGGCGWHAGKLAPAGARSVGVEIFGLDAKGDAVPARDLEPLLHAELSRAVSDWVDLPLVSSSAADLVVKGHLTGYRRRGGIRSPDNELLETGVRLTLEAELVERRTGRSLASSQAGRWSNYALGDPLAELAARQRLMRSLSELLVLDLFGPLSYKSAAWPPAAATDGEAQPSAPGDIPDTQPAPPTAKSD